ncbi:unnamed protein product [Paramecium sonneborni]|uniref:Uncharacterized protein n=1 Tax=Paramecium sonneborni TaxID=65129 RepID=A0A8S1RRI9_9CILI|nr:unnamed protein product [Paramecium sonneborni]
MFTKVTNLKLINIKKNMQIRDELEQQFISKLTIERQNLEDRLQKQNIQEIQQLSYQFQQTQLELNQNRSKQQ